MCAHGNSLRDSKAVGLTPFISPLGAWALSLGSSIGWGSFVITSNTYLAYAGPFGSGIGMLIGACIILIITRNYHFLMNRYPDSGGVYSYTRQVLGYDYAFLTVWFLSLTYLAVLWANATSLPLFARYFLGDMFQAVPLYQVFGYQVYLGETLLTICAILVAGLVCAGFKKSSVVGMIVLAFVFTLGITLCFVCVMLRHDPASFPMEPAFIPGENKFFQIVRSACRYICTGYKHSPVFRIGGDEFVVILQGEDYRNRNEILDRMNRETDEGQSPGGIQIAFGLSEFIPGSDSYARSVFDRADAMMYLRKKEMKQARRT